MIAGRYTLDREVGRGGMGAVWLARDEVLGRDVAVKRVGIAPGGSTPDLERAQREARLAARLNHPHVVAVYDLVTEGDERWLVMEYVEGVTLSALVQDEGALTPAEVSPLLGQVADALAAAHSAGIIHRDVKPSNILVTADGQVKLSDFGIARAEADATLTQTGLVTGSPAYLAPEVASGSSATDASDVWSLGATLFHALAGHPPYEVGDNLMGALYRIVHEEPPRLANAGWLAPLLEATMTRDPADRWTMAQVRDFLEAGPADTTLRPAPTVAVAASETKAFPPVPSPAETAPTPVFPGGAAPEAVPEPLPQEPATTSSRRRIGLVPVLLVAAVLAVAGLIAWIAFTGPEPGDRTGANPDTTSVNGDQSPPPEESPGTEPTAAGMEDFVAAYLSTVTTDPDTAWSMLTRDFQRASGGYDSYLGYWETIDVAELVSVDADPESLVVSYDVDYVKEDGSTMSDSVTLDLVYRDGSYLIDGET